MRRTTACFLGLCLLFVATPSWAQTITLVFNSLPTAQGWSYQGQVLQTNAFSVDGTNLTLNTIGQGNVAAVYFRLNIINPDLPFTISLRARVLQADVNGALAVSSFTGTENVSFLVGSGSVRVQGAVFPQDTTQFHDYRLEAVPGVGYRLFVDDVLLSGFPNLPTTVTQNSVLFGDGSAGPQANAFAEIQQFTFSQTPALSLQALIDQLEDLGSPGGPIPEDDARGLIAKLTNSLRLLKSGNPRPSCNLLLAFINDVNLQVVQGTMPVALGNALVSLVLATREDLSC